ncbi:hypothetical protein [Trujillonella humicola]|uniref:hypothetical protein n=1 Tax=Trujillonella humicola TaxID=3383699 RepID=UPI00390658A3
MTAQQPRQEARRTARWPLPRVSVPTLVVLAVLDLALVVASALDGAPGSGPGDGAFSLETDGGLVEYVGYAHQLALVVLLLTLWRLGRGRVWLAWAAVFTLVLADDSARLHETLGDRAAAALHLQGVAGLRADDLGEVVVWGLLAAAPLLAIVVLHRGSDRDTRAASRGLAALVAVYAFFGVVVDQVHAAARDSALGAALGTLEDGGELLALSLTLAHVVVLVGAARRFRPPAAPPAQSPERSAAAASSSPA